MSQDLRWTSICTTLLMNKYDDRWATLAITVSFLTEVLMRHKNISLSSHRIKEGLKHQWQKQGILVPVFINLTLTWGNDTAGVACESSGIIVTPLWPPMTGTLILSTSSPCHEKKTCILNLICGITSCNISSSQQFQLNQLHLINCRFEKRRRNEDFFSYYMYKYWTIGPHCSTKQQLALSKYLTIYHLSPFGKRCDSQR